MKENRKEINIYVDDKLKCLDQVPHSSDYVKRQDFLMFQEDFSNIKDAVERVTDVLLMGYKTESNHVLKGKVDRTEVEDMIKKKFKEVGGPLRDGKGLHDWAQSFSDVTSLVEQTKLLTKVQNKTLRSDASLSDLRSGLMHVEPLYCCLKRIAAGLACAQNSIVASPSIVMSPDALGPTPPCLKSRTMRASSASSVRSSFACQPSREW